MSRQCFVCQSSALEPLLDVGPQPISNRFLKRPTDAEERFPIALRQCGTCGLVQIEQPVPAAALIPPHDWVTYSEPEAHLDGLVDILMTLPGVAAGGIAGGVSFKDDTTLARLERKGLRTWRLDLGDDLGVTDGRGGHGVETIQDRLTPEAARAIAARKGRADVLLVRHILEHTASRSSSWRRWRSSRNRTATSSSKCRTAVVCSTCATTPRSGGHTHYFTPNTFPNALTLAAFNVVRMETYPYPFENSLVAIATPPNGRAAGAPLPDAAIARERERGLAFGRAFAGYRDKVRAFLADHRRQHGLIALFGAGHLACTWISVFGVAGDIECVIEDNPNKRGLFMQVRGS